MEIGTQPVNDCKVDAETQSACIPIWEVAVQRLKIFMQIKKTENKRVTQEGTNK